VTVDLCLFPERSPPHSLECSSIGAFGQCSCKPWPKGLPSSTSEHGELMLQSSYCRHKLSFVTHRYSFSLPDIQHVMPAQRCCYLALPDHHLSSSTAHSIDSGCMRTPYPAGIFLTALRFSPPTTHAGMPAAACFGIVWLPAALLSGDRKFLLLRRTTRRYVSGLPLLWSSECLYRRRGFCATRELRLTGHLDNLT